MQLTTAAGGDLERLGLALRLSFFTGEPYTTWLYVNQNASDNTLNHAQSITHAKNISLFYSATTSDRWLQSHMLIFTWGLAGEADLDLNKQTVVHNSATSKSHYEQWPLNMKLKIVLNTSMHNTKQNDSK